MNASDFRYPSRIYKKIISQPGGAGDAVEEAWVPFYEPVVAWDMEKSGEKFMDDTRRGFDYPWIWFRHLPPGISIVQGNEIEVDYWTGTRRFITEGVVGPNRAGFDAWCLKCEGEVEKGAC